MFVIEQDECKFWEQEKPAVVHRATRSPSFGIRVFEQVATFATRAEAEAWVADQKRHSRDAK